MMNIREIEAAVRSVAAAVEAKYEARYRLQDITQRRMNAARASPSQYRELCDEENVRRDQLKAAEAAIETKIQDVTLTLARLL